MATNKVALQSSINDEDTDKEKNKKKKKKTEANITTHVRPSAGAGSRETDMKQDFFAREKKTILSHRLPAVV